MEKTIIIILLENRKETAVSVQNILTDFGCIIKTRLGIHDGIMKECSDSGLIILEVIGDKKKKQEMIQKLEGISHVKTKMVELSLAK